MTTKKKESGLQKRRKMEGFQEGARKERKQWRKVLKIEDQGVDGVDLISQLPDHLLHHILSRLHCHKDAARTSVLSRRWRNIWNSLSVLEFDQHRFRIEYGKLKEKRKLDLLDVWRRYTSYVTKEEEEMIEKFRGFVDNTLQNRIGENSRIKKFILRLTVYDIDLAIAMDRWLHIATENNVQELELHLPKRHHQCYKAPQTIFTAKTITSLKIFGCTLEACDDIRFSNLQKLCLGKLHVSDKIFENFLRSCPLIEDLRLIRCRGLKRLLISSSKISRVDLHLCDALKKVELQAPNLQSFWYHGKKFVACNFNLVMCKSLKSLTLEAAKMTNDSFQNLISNFPVLEQLTLSKCSSLNSITISCHQLKMLVLRECRNLKEADIDTPNLLSFEYKGDKMPFSSLNPASLKEAKIYFGGHTSSDPAWNTELQEFLSNFCKDLILVVRSEKNVIVHKDMKGKILIPPSRDLKLEIVKSSICLEDIVDKLLGIWHPKTLCILSSTISNSSEHIYSKMVGRERMPHCCKYSTQSNKCWRHFLKNVVVKDLHDAGEESEWFAWLKPYLVEQMIACFKLDWTINRKKEVSN